jgi:hypothetical protein
MHTRLIAGAAVPDFDKDIAAWLRKSRDYHDDEPGIVRIGIRNQDRCVYRHITLRGKRQHLDAIGFLDQSGFAALPVGFARETGLDYVFHHADW